MAGSEAHELPSHDVSEKSEPQSCLPLPHCWSQDTDPWELKWMKPSLALVASDGAAGQRAGDLRSHPLKYCGRPDHRASADLWPIVEFFKLKGNSPKGTPTKLWGLGQDASLGCCTCHSHLSCMGMLFQGLPSLGSGQGLFRLTWKVPITLTLRWQRSLGHLVPKGPRDFLCRFSHSLLSSLPALHSHNGFRRKYAHMFTCIICRGYTQK